MKITPIVVFAIVEVLCATLAWLSGFNFDRRNPEVGFYSMVSLFIGLFFAGMSIDFTKD